MTATNSPLGSTVKILTDYLFKNEITRLELARVQMVQRNREMSDKPVDGFFFNTRLYHNAGPGIPVHGSSIGLLHPDLHKDMNDLSKDEAITERETTEIRMALAVLLAPCRSAQDVRDTLPNGLGTVLPGAKDLPRTRPVAFTIEGNSRAQKQWGRVKEKIDFYLAAKLLY